MAYLTRAEAINAFRVRTGSIYLAEAELRKSSRTPRDTRFDVFLSHSSEDAAIIAGVKVLLEREGFTVYVDWVDDPQADRSRVTAAIAGLLRSRMDHSRFLLYASSRNSSNSKWMPWELGYFDGKRPGHVGILPIVATAAADFVGVEYLGIYPKIERLDFSSLGPRFGRRTGTASGRTLSSLAAS